MTRQTITVASIEARHEVVVREPADADWCKACGRVDTAKHVEAMFLLSRLRRAANGLIGSASGSALTRPPSHGGYREGSGRKPILDGGIKRTFVLTPAHLAMIDAWGQHHMIDNRSAALRHLIEHSLG